MASNTTTFMLPLSLFDIVNHVKSDSRTYIEYLELKIIISKLKLVNYKVLDLFKLYNFDKIHLNLMLYEKVMIFFVQNGNHCRFKAQTGSDSTMPITTGSSHKPPTVILCHCQFQNNRQ
jgi:hypothetical protein